MSNVKQLHRKIQNTFSVKWKKNWFFSSREKKPLLSMPSSQFLWVIYYRSAPSTLLHIPEYNYSTFGFRMSNVKQYHRKIESTVSFSKINIDCFLLKERSPYSPCQALKFMSYYYSSAPSSLLHIPEYILHLDFVWTM